MTAHAEGRPRLYDGRFVTLLTIVFLGFAAFAVIGPVVPLLILELGGDAATVGVIVAIYSVPSVLVRPFLGQLVDRWNQRGVWLLGAVGLTIASLLYLVPALAFIAVLRLFHGTAWAAFNTGGNTTLARIAPPSRRTEAAGIFGLMPSLAHMLLPSVGLLLVGGLGTSSAFIAAGVMAAAAAAVIYLGAFPSGPLADPGTARGRMWRNLIERRALLPMALEFLWMTVNVLFFIFPPLFAEANGIPIEALVIYYPIVGGVLIVTRLLVGPRLDGLPRLVPLTIAAASGVVALLTASFADSVLSLTLAGSIFAFGTTFISPIAMALAIDRADSQRRGAAMATYSLGYQLGFGLGSLVWGFVIRAAGFPAPFLLGLLSMTGIAVVAFSARIDLRQRPDATPAG
jgi:predicted MFS family arabinose efflux permease